MPLKMLRGLRVAAIVADGFEQVELTIPKKALEKRKAQVEILSLRPGRILGMNLLWPGKKVRADRTIFTADPSEFDALLLPGGFINPDFLRQTPAVLNFVRAFDRAGKPIATLCHGPWTLASAGLVAGRTMTSWPGIKDDLKNAGARWVDDSLVRDRNWVSSRGPHDMPQFIQGMVQLFAEALPEQRTTPEFHYGRLALGGLALAGTGLVLGRYVQSRL